MLKIQVEIQRPEKQYEILLEPGLATDWKREVEDRVPAENYIVIVDSQLARIRNIPHNGEKVGKWGYIPFDGGEGSKTLDQFASLCQKAFLFNPDRDTVIVAFGGATTGDMASFLSATMLHGLRLVLVPTSLAAQIDRSVGGRNRINAGSVHNGLGTVWHPELVLIDPTVLESLPRREYVSGLSEMVKTAVVESADFFEQLRRGKDSLLTMNHGFLAGAIARCCRVKSGLVAADEFCRGEQLPLRFGHNFGELLAVLAGSRVRHGEAISVGMVLAARLSVERGIFPLHEYTALRELLSGFGLPVDIAQLGAEDDDRLDWKTILKGENVPRELLWCNDHLGDRLGLVLPHAIGSCRFERTFTSPTLLTLPYRRGRSRGRWSRGSWGGW